MKDGKLYGLEAEHSDVLIRADMALVDSAHVLLGCADQIAQKSGRYWAEVRKTLSRCSSTVREFLGSSLTDKERHEYLRSRLLVQSSLPTSSTLFVVDNE